MALITYLTKIQFDFGAIRLLAEEMGFLGIKRPLIVTDEGIGACGLLDRVRDVMPADMSVTVFDGTPANPTEPAVRDALGLYREATCDGIVAVGGGSSIDLAKGVRLLATHQPPLAQYAMIEGGAARIGADVAPLIAVPTTAGTGSEVGRAGIIILDDGRKLAIASAHLIPDVALCDPDLTADLPPGLTAATGMDAIAHCIETFISNVDNPPAEAIAIEGLRRASAHLDRAYRDGGDREARWNMMMASTMGAMAFQKGLGAVHAMSHPLGGLQDLKLHHGTLNAVVMPAVLRFNADHTGDKYDRIREAMGLSAGADLPAYISGLNERLGLPATLRAMGVTDDLLPDLARQAVADHCTETNPRPVNESDYVVLFREAMG